MQKLKIGQSVTSNVFKNQNNFVETETIQSEDMQSYFDSVSKYPTPNILDKNQHQNIDPLQDYD